MILKQKHCQKIYLHACDSWTLMMPLSPWRELSFNCLQDLKMNNLLLWLLREHYRLPACIKVQNEHSSQTGASRSSECPNSEKWQVSSVVQPLSRSHFSSFIWFFMAETHRENSVYCNPRYTVGNFDGTSIPMFTLPLCCVIMKCRRKRKKRWRLIYGYTGFWWFWRTSFLTYTMESGGPGTSGPGQWIMTASLRGKLTRRIIK